MWPRTRRNTAEKRPIVDHMFEQLALEILHRGSLVQHDAARTADLALPRDARPAPQRPASWATPLLVLINLLAFVALFIAAGCSLQIDIETLVRFGANDRQLHAQPWRLLTCTFLHADRVALLTNLWWLTWTGTLVERRIGSWALVALYFTSSAAAGLTSAVWNPAAVSVGASGAIWGVWGLIIGLIVFDSRSRADQHLRAIFVFVVLAIVADLSTSSLRPHIDTAAHLGGLLSGMTLAATAFLVARMIKAVDVTCVLRPCHYP